MHSLAVVAFIKALAPVATALAPVAKALVEALSEKSARKAKCAKSTETAVSFPKEKGNEALQAYKERMDREEMEVKSLQKRIRIIHAEGLELDKRADEAFSTYGTNVLVIMLFHGFGSVFLQLNYPYFGTWVSVCMVVSFFSTFLVACIVCGYKTENLCELEKDLQRRQIELQKDIADFGAETKRTHSVEKLKTFESIGAFGEVLNGINRDAGALQSTIAGILENSSHSQSNRMKSLNQVAVCAILYGLSFPMMASYLLYYVDFGRMRFVY